MPAGEAQPGIVLSQQEYDRARLDLLRRRVAAFGAAVGVLLILLVALQFWFSGANGVRRFDRPGSLSLACGIAVGVALILMPRLRRQALQRVTLRSLVWRTIWILTMAVLSQFTGARIMAAGLASAIEPLGLHWSIGPSAALAVFMLLMHTAAAIIVPWTVLESLIPPLALSSLAAVLSLSGSDPTPAPLAVGLALLAGAPGVAITMFRASGLRETLGLRLIGARYAEVERELVFARRLHERLFPSPIEDGPIRLAYAYEPMRQIGGDFLDVARGPEGSLMVVMIDVTGHGVASALAVNRLHGELKRILAENATCTPGDLIAGLNRYVHLTLADEAVFATAVAARVESNGRTTLCIAGHPPPMLISNGEVSTLDPTAAMLGALPPDIFDAAQSEVRIGSGQSLLLYTDGAIECRDVAGRDLGITGLQQFARASSDPAELPAALLAQVRSHRSGAAEDDTLIAAITRLNG